MVLGRGAVTQLTVLLAVRASMDMASVSPLQMHVRRAREWYLNVLPWMALLTVAAENLEFPSLLLLARWSPPSLSISTRHLSQYQEDASNAHTFIAIFNLSFFLASLDQTYKYYNNYCIA